jgi:transposase
MAVLPPRTAPENVEIWFQDEARVGQQGTITRQWSIKGTRPRAIRQQQFLSAYIFGAVCAAENKAAAIISPFVSVDALNEHLLEISSQVGKGKLAVLVMDKAGWHISKKIMLPGNIFLLFLPPYSPELNPQERPWSWLKQRHLANRTFENVEHIIDACCIAWNDFVSQPDLIRSMCSRSWATLLPVINTYL